MHRPDDRLYVVSRSDLPVGLQAAQCVHAAAQFAHDKPDLFRRWQETSQWLVLVTVPDEAALLRLCADASKAMHPFVEWREPDLDGAVTAIALAPGGPSRRLTANLPLLGRGATAASAHEPGTMDG